ncbi:hypothetical protein UlMin_043031 [Ulmus minor]
MCCSNIYYEFIVLFVWLRVDEEDGGEDGLEERHLVVVMTRESSGAGWIPAIAGYPRTTVTPPADWVKFPCVIVHKSIDCTRNMDCLVNLRMYDAKILLLPPLLYEGPLVGRGTQAMKKVAKGRLSVNFKFTLMQAICDNAEWFNNEIGYNVRKHCSFRYKEWRLVPPEIRAPLRDRLLNTFDINLKDPRVEKVIDRQMRRAWTGYKYKLHAHFKEIGGEKDITKAKNQCPEDLSKDDWNFLCDRWTDPSFMDWSKKNANSRAKRKWDSRNGSRSTARHHVSRGVDLDAPEGHIETWSLRHWHPEHGWTTPELERKFATYTSDESGCPTYDQLVEDLNKYKSRFEELEGDVDMMRQVLISKNLLPPISRPHISDNSSGPSSRFHPHPSRHSNSEFMDENP